MPTLKEMKTEAKRLGIRKYYEMNKPQLQEALFEAKIPDTHEFLWEDEHNKFYIEEDDDIPETHTNSDDGNQELSQTSQIKAIKIKAIKE